MTSLDFFVSLALLPASMAPVPAVAVILVWRLHRDELAHPLVRSGSPDDYQTTSRSEPSA